VRKPCLTCGLPCEDTYCDEHQRKGWQHRETSARARGYDTAWDKLSRRARRIQPWCSLCLSTDDLTTDHLPEAWRRKAEGKSIRLRDVRVLCSPCNVDAGSSRPEDQGKGTLDGRSGPPVEAKSPLLTCETEGKVAESLLLRDASLLDSSGQQRSAQRYKASDDVEGAAQVVTLPAVLNDRKHRFACIAIDVAQPFGHDSNGETSVLVLDVGHDGSLP